MSKGQNLSPPPCIRADLYLFAFAIGSGDLGDYPNETHRARCRPSPRTRIHLSPSTGRQFRSSRLHRTASADDYRCCYIAGEYTASPAAAKLVKPCQPQSASNEAHRFRSPLPDRWRPLPASIVARSLPHRLHVIRSLDSAHSQFAKADGVAASEVSGLSLL